MSSERAVALSRIVSELWPEGAAFWQRSEPDARAPLGVGFRAGFASVPRRLAARAAERPEPARYAALAPLARPHWTLTDLTRAALLARAFRFVPEAEQVATHLRLFEAGELGEQVSLLRTLPLLEQPERFLETAVQACRSNARDVFEAIVCESSFPAAHFPALNFNQAVLKAIFMEVSARRIEGLEARITRELQRMAADYGSERRAAGRSVPEDIGYILSQEVTT